MIYLLLKSLHLAAALIFISGLLLLAVVTKSWPLAGGQLLPHEKRIGHAVLQWDRYVTGPAMIAAWALGLGLAVSQGWWGQGWLIGKIMLVVALSGGHGMLTATLRRRMERLTAPSSAWLRYGPVAVVVCAMMISVLVVVKP